MTCFIQPCFVSVFVVCQTSSGPLYLIMKRCGKYLTGTWQMVTGKIEEGETAARAAFREVQEETGLTPLHLYSADAVETFYMQSENKIAFVPVFVAFVDSMEVRLSPTEHDAFEWVALEQAKEQFSWAEQKRIISLIHHSCVLQKPADLLIANLHVPAQTRRTVSRTGVYGIFLQNEKLLVVKQNKGPHQGKFDLPGGGIEPGETIDEALHREFKEELGMTFASKKFMHNLTAVTEGSDENGSPYLLHQIALIYQLEGLSSLELSFPEMDFFWIELSQLSKKPISPLIQQLLTHQKNYP